MKNRELRIGDTVKVIGYGGIVWWSKVEWERAKTNGMTYLDKPSNIIKEDDNYYWTDICPKVVGQIGRIASMSGDNNYSLEGIKGKTAWYVREQLELLLQPEEEEFLEFLSKIEENVGEGPTSLLIQHITHKFKEIWQIQ